MDVSDMYVNDLIYYKQLQTNDIEKQILNNSIKKKIITLPLKKKTVIPKSNSSVHKKTFYMIEREVYYE